MRSILQDLKYALRQLRKSPGFAFAAVAVLALGLGANIAVFTVLNGIFLRPLPYAHPDRIVTVELPNDDPRFFDASMSYANMLQLRDAAGPQVQAAGGFGSGTEEVMVNAPVASGPVSPGAGVAVPQPASGFREIG